MADIAVFHPYLDTRGGGEAICMRVIEALQDEHAVTVYSLNDPDITRLNAHFSTDVTSVGTRQLGARGAALRCGGELIRELTDRPTRRLQGALAYSYVDSQGHDLVFSTYNEFGFESPSIQYIHFPNFGPEIDGEPTSLIEQIYGSICNTIHRGTDEQVRNSILITNSEWSADVVQDVYGVRPRVVCPPVDTSKFHPQPWHAREDGFVSLGRADPAKRPLAVFDIVDELTSRGHDIHLHWIGKVPDDDYGERVRKRAAEVKGIQLEGHVPHPRLTELLSTHKYGFHGRINEHFGIAVAEMLAGGTLPFVHDSGGQREIVGTAERVTYRNRRDAVDKIDRILEAGNGPEIVNRLPDPESKFGLSRFRRSIREAVSNAPKSGQRQITDINNGAN